MVTDFARLGPLSDYTENCRPVLSSKRVPHAEKKETFRQAVISGHKFQSGHDTKIDCQS
jgi:hypothetical protein